MHMPTYKTPHMDTWRDSEQRSERANPGTTTKGVLVADAERRGAYFTHETPLHHFESAVAHGSFAPSELAALRTGTRPTHDAGHIQSGAFYSRQVVARGGDGVRFNTSKWDEGQVGADKPIAVVLRPSMMHAGPTVARTLDGGNNHDDPVPQRTNPHKAALMALTETARLDAVTQRSAEVAVSGIVPMHHVAAIVVKHGDHDLAQKMERDFGKTVATSATFEGMGAAAHLAGRVIVAAPGETRGATIRRVHTQFAGK